MEKYGNAAAYEELPKELLLGQRDKFTKDLFWKDVEALIVQYTKEPKKSNLALYSAMTSEVYRKLCRARTTLSHSCVSHRDS
ncbi:hypothetical protein JHK87_047754 [Glycine soja]|nr:hypothetical protein JHK87_047754 [Glycine soja]